ncbi:MAG: hypothetical protein S4CHLAM20_08940 [Chlamydiia bacterium]|nr:hypothetical protein [Chlamydiia bacterium]
MYTKNKREFEFQYTDYLTIDKLLSYLVTFSTRLNNKKGTYDEAFKSVAIMSSLNFCYEIAKQVASKITSEKERATIEKFINLNQVATLF